MVVRTVRPTGVLTDRSAHRARAPAIGAGRERDCQHSVLQPPTDALGAALARCVQAREHQPATPMLQRLSIGDIASYLNPRWYAPVGLWGYNPAQMLAFTGPARLLPPTVRDAFAAKFNVVAAAAKRAHNDVMRAEFGDLVTLIDDIHARRTKLLIGVSLEDAAASNAQAVSQELVDATLVDLVTIAQTPTGRDLLTAIARAAPDAPRVFIQANDLVVAPASNPRDRHAPASTPQISDVPYTPTAFKAGRARNSRQNVAELTRFTALNAWILPRRSDVTLYHELVHALHTQTGAAREKTALVTALDATIPLDAPAERAGIGGGVVRSGVSEEEYATVGLGVFADDRFTENRYRAERRALGEDVPHRGHYTQRPLAPG